LNSNDEAEVTLDRKGPGVVTAGDFDLGHDIEIANPEHVIANLNENGHLKLRAQVGRGRGYEPADIRIADEKKAELLVRCCWTHPTARCSESLTKLIALVLSSELTWISW